MRAQKKRKRKKAFPWRQLGIFTLVGALAILTGWMINTLVVQGYLWAPVDQDPPGQVGTQPDPPPDDPGPSDNKPPVSVTADVNLRSVQFYLTQVGAVGTEAGAKALVNDFNEKGNAAAYHFDGQLYRVFAGISADKAASDALGEMFRSMQIDAFTKEVSWSGRKGQVTGVAGAYLATVQPAITEMENAFATLLGTQALGQDQINSLQSAVANAQATLTQTEPASDVARLHSALVAAANELKSAVDATRQFIETGNDHSRFASEGNLIEFAQLYQGFAQEIGVLLP